MSITLEIQPETEQALSEEASKRGISAAEYALQILETFVHPRNKSYLQSLTAEEREYMSVFFAHGSSPQPSSESLRRENMYE